MPEPGAMPVGCRFAARCARETLAEEGQCVLDCVSFKFFRVPICDHAAPTPAAVRVVFVHLDTDARVLAEHRDLAALLRNRDDRAVAVGVDDGDDVRLAAGVAAEARDPLAEQELLDFVAVELPHAGLD